MGEAAEYEEFLLAGGDIDYDSYFEQESLRTEELEDMHRLYNDLEKAIHANTKESKHLWKLDNRLSGMITIIDEEPIYDPWDAVAELINEIEVKQIKLETEYENVKRLILNRIEELEKD